MHTSETATLFVNVILPLAVPKPYTYQVPAEWADEVQFGIRVEVQLRNKLYSGIVVEVHRDAPKEYATKPILSLIDTLPVIQAAQYKLWQWIASYYCCPVGDVMAAALPANLKLVSETVVELNPEFNEQFEGLDDKEYLIAEALTIQNELSIEDVRKILDQKTVYPLIIRLLNKGVLLLKEELKTKFTPKKVSCVILAEPYASDQAALQQAFEKVQKSEKQTQALLAYLQISKGREFIQTKEVCEKAGVESTVLKDIAKKGIFELYERIVSRISTYKNQVIKPETLTAEQERVLGELDESFQNHNVVLLHGVTGSGKTRVYVELIQKAIQSGGQVLYLLPEIALSTQIISRLQKIFGDQIAVYHSRLNNNERVELWKDALAGKPVILGVRSAMFLPFQNLQWIIIDEEHDPSYKQDDPNPRYNARDTSIFLAQLNNAKVLLGTATPSIETYYNVQTGKYGLVEMPERYGGIQMPEILLVDLAKEAKERKMQSHFSSVLIDHLKETIARGEQAILFQNRRGYSPTLQCNVCGWTAQCVNCDVTLTYHKFSGHLHCHYCGYQRILPKECPNCNSKQIQIRGFGTERIEDDLQIYLPDARIGRMDFDSVRSKHAHAKIIQDFEEHRLDILVGTQMVTKGLDFDKVALVGVISAGQLLQFPDFRSSERAFQLITQVSGRAGRKNRQGLVIVQSYNIQHPVLKDIVEHNFDRFYQRELDERKKFKYPPYYRLIQILMKHKDPKTLQRAAGFFTAFLKDKLGNRLQGPAIPSVARVRNYYLLEWLIKLERDAGIIQYSKNAIQDAVQNVQLAEGFASVKIQIDVDPA